MASHAFGDARWSWLGTRRGAGRRTTSNETSACPIRWDTERLYVFTKWRASASALPILTIIDTPGAFPGIGAEERGQSEAIGACLAAMARAARVPIVATIIGEGGSGGARALGVAPGNRVLVLEYGTYSVISPEGCASILLERRQPRRRSVPGAFKMTSAPDLLRSWAWSIASSTSRARWRPIRTPTLPLCSSRSSHQTKTLRKRTRVHECGRNRGRDRYRRLRRIRSVRRVRENRVLLHP